MPVWTRLTSLKGYTPTISVDAYASLRVYISGGSIAKIMETQSMENTVLKMHYITTLQVTLAKVNYDRPPLWNMYAQGRAHNEEHEGRRKG